jgi:hypothetical protein
MSPRSFSSVMVEASYWWHRFLTGTSMFRKCWTAGRHSLPSHGKCQLPALGGWSALAAATSSPRWLLKWSPGCGPDRQTRCVGQQMGSNRPPSGPTRSLENRGRSSEGSGTENRAHLQLYDDPSRSVTIRCSGRQRLVGSDTEEAGRSTPPAPTTPSLTSANALYQGSLAGSQGHRPDGMGPYSGQEHFTC